MSEKSKDNLNKYAIDNSATFYPFFMTKRSQSLFSVNAVLCDGVDVALLRQAANDVLNRFPSYKTKLKKTYGGYCLLQNDAEVDVFPLHANPIRPLDFKEIKGFLFRISAGGNKITLDMFHVLTDANGAIRFLSAILRRYRELQGAEFANDCDVPAYDSQIQDGELEDSFKANYEKVSLSEIGLKDMAGGSPYRVSGDYLGDFDRIFFGGTAEVSDLVEKAKAMGVSVSGYLTGLLAYGLHKHEGANKPIVIMVPVNLRKIFPSVTASNFVTFVRVIVKQGEFDSIEHCIKDCSKKLAEAASERKMRAFISTTVRAQKSFLFRMVPRGLKLFFIRLGRLFLKSRQTIIFSNIGKVFLPEQLGVKSLGFNVNVSKNNLQNLSAVSYDGKCRLCFTSATDNMRMPNDFFDTLKEGGIGVTMDENQ